MILTFSPDFLWLLIFAFLIAFILAVAVGANDVANSFGTSVGSGVLSFRQACILATIFEISGSILVGYKVADTMRKGILDVELFDGDEKTFMLGMLSALIGSSAWLLIATFFRLPVSTTHSIVGSTVGFSLVVHGVRGFQWETLVQIIISWFVSPILSGVVAVLIYLAIIKFIISPTNALKAALIALPIIYGVTIFFNVLGVLMDGSKLLGLQDLPIWLSLTISFILSIIAAIVVQFLLVPWQRKKILEEQEATNDVEGTEGDGLTVKSSRFGNVEENGKIVDKLFKFLQILSAIFTSFAHGGNDVTNAVGPLIAIWTVYSEGSVLQKTESPIWILFFGGLGMAFGMWIFGKRVNETVGKNITKITATTGFTVETSAAATVLLASKVGIPVSSTHCIVGSVVFIGCFFGDKLSGKKVDWSLFRSIVYAWLVTLPVAAGISALFMFIFMNV